MYTGRNVMLAAHVKRLDSLIKANVLLPKVPTSEATTSTGVPSIAPLYPGSRVSATTSNLLPEDRWQSDFSLSGSDHSYYSTPGPSSPVALRLLKNVDIPTSAAALASLLVTNPTGLEDWMRKAKQAMGGQQ